MPGAKAAGGAKLRGKVNAVFLSKESAALTSSDKLPSSSHSRRTSRADMLRV
jgi:hypothetical protein